MAVTENKENEYAVCMVSIFQDVLSGGACDVRIVYMIPERESNVFFDPAVPGDRGGNIRHEGLVGRRSSEKDRKTTEGVVYENGFPKTMKRCLNGEGADDKN